jgi:hypothetical protein
MLLELWRRTKGDCRYPSRGKFTPATLKPWLGHIALVDVSYEPLRFRVRLAGTKVVALASADITARWIDECAPQKQHFAVLDAYERCIKTGAPGYSNAIHATRSLQQLARYRLHYRLLLPCAEDGAQIDSIVVGVYGSEAFSIPDEP